MSKHTPGPWKFQPGYLTIYTTSNPERGTGTTNALAKVLTRDDSLGSSVEASEAQANARLIAASPAMYAAIAEVIADMQDHFNEAELAQSSHDDVQHGSESLIGSWRDKLRAALPRGAADAE